MITSALILLTLTSLGLPVLGDNNQTIQIPIFEPDKAGMTANGTQIIPYSGEPIIEIPWRNESYPATIHVNEYVTCVNDSQQKYIESSHRLGTNMSLEGNRPIDLLDSDMDTCIIFNSEN
jgi:hypothetical protein